MSVHVYNEGGSVSQVQVRSEGHHIVLEVDSQESLRIGHVTETLSDGLDTLMRFAVGGILTNHTQLMEPLQTPLDGCLRGWTWLGQSPAWLPDSAPLTPPKLCFSSHRRGSYFPGAGKAVFRTQDFLPGAVSQDGQWSLSVQMQLQSVTDSFPLLTVSHPESGLLLSLRGSHKTIVLDVGRSTTLTVAVPELGGCGASLLLLEMTSKKVTLRVGHDLSKLPVSEEEYIAVRDAWQGGAELHLGGDLGVSPQYFHGCLQNILLQGKTVDLDSALSKSDRIWSHSCPQPAGETA
ncbi:sex hormone-binding globulin-like [Ascaphus truei]|uniref:sex hormone-binding globulin-like n=1 Tax=Ascaphus truei TaxID=8439 RepID=UPI003F5A3608